MSASTAPSIVLAGPRRRAGEIAVGCLLTAAVAALLLALGPAPGDAPAHLYRTLLVDRGDFVWDNFWYAGQYPLASYSLLYYLPAAVVGNVPFVFAASVASTALFASITLREWGTAALWPSRVFGVLAAAPLFTGLYAYSLGFATMLGALRALQGRRVRTGLVLAGLTVGFSPLAFAFLCLVVVAAASRRRVSRRWFAIGGGLAAVGTVEVTALLLFASPGSYPFHWINFAGVLLVSALGTLVAHRARGGRPIAAFFVLWALGSVVAFVVPSPLGDNWTRLDAFVLPVMLLATALAGFRPRPLVSLALAVALAYNLIPYLLLIPFRLDSRPTHAAFWQPAIGFLRRELPPGYRVEVVPTAAHWESYWLPKAGFPVARGWYRQLDMADNPALYRKHLGARAYRRWLRRNAVRYVLLPNTRLDADGGPAEARVVESPGSGLVLAFRSANWRIYRLPDPTPLVTGAGRATVTSFGHTAIHATVTAPGRYLVRAHYSPYWSLAGRGCVGPAPGGMTLVHLTSAGPFTLRVPGNPAALFEAATADRDRGC